MSSEPRSAATLLECGHLAEPWAGFGWGDPVFGSTRECSRCAREKGEGFRWQRVVAKEEHNDADCCVTAASRPGWTRRTVGRLDDLAYIIRRPSVLRYAAGPTRVWVTTGGKDHFRLVPRWRLIVAAFSRKDVRL